MGGCCSIRRGDGFGPSRTPAPWSGIAPTNETIRIAIFSGLPRLTRAAIPGPPTFRSWAVNQDRPILNELTNQGSESAVMSAQPEPQRQLVRLRGRSYVAFVFSPVVPIMG